MPRLIVFDFDDTLVGSQNVFRVLLSAYCGSVGIPEPCYETLKKHYADPDNHDYWKGMSKAEQKKHLEAYYTRLFDPHHPEFPRDVVPELYKETEQALEELQGRGYTLAIVTARGQATLEYYLQYHNILDHFAAIRTRDDHVNGERIKPAPDQLLSVMKQLDFVPDNTLMIGDTTMDIEMARAAAVPSVGVTWGCHTQDILLAAGADYVIDDHMLKLLDVIDDLWPGIHSG